MIFCLVVRGVYPPYTLSGPTTKNVLCVSPLTDLEEVDGVCLEGVIGEGGEGCGGGLLGVHHNGVPPQHIVLNKDLWSMYI